MAVRLHSHKKIDIVNSYWSVGLSVQGGGVDAAQSVPHADVIDLLPQVGIRKGARSL